MQKPQPKRAIWVVCATLAALLVGGTARMGVQLKPYWIAKYHGYNSDLHGAMLSGAPLADADLRFADLQRATLTGANLRRADLLLSKLEHARLGGANLEGARLSGATLYGADLRGADLVGAHLLGYQVFDIVEPSANLAGAQYDTRTRWPGGFHPAQHGAILVK